MRVLVTSTGGSGHFGPLVPLLDGLRRRGDDVLVVVPPGAAAAAEATGHLVTVGAEPDPAVVRPLWASFPELSRPERSLLVEREIFGRLCTEALLPAVERAAHSFRPDLVLHETCEYAAAVVADRLGLAQARVAISAAEAEAGAQALAAPALDHYGPDVAGRLAAAPYLTRLPASLDPSPFAATVRFRERPGDDEPLADYWPGLGGPLVYLTLGSVAASVPAAAASYRFALEAVQGLAARVLCTLGRDLDPGGLGPVGDHVRLEAWVPQARVLEHAAVVVCHGGSGTTFGALAAGVPLVFVPFFADQPANARRCAGAGAGLVVGPNARGEGPVAPLGPGDVAPLRAAIDEVLSDGSFAASARRLAEEMAAFASVDEVLAQLAGR